MLLWFLLGVGLGIGISCLLYCVYSNIRTNRQNRKDKVK